MKPPHETPMLDPPSLRPLPYETPPQFSPPAKCCSGPSSDKRSSGCSSPRSPTLGTYGAASVGSASMGCPGGGRGGGPHLVGGLLAAPQVPHDAVAAQIPFVLQAALIGRVLPIHPMGGGW